MLSPEQINEQVREMDWTESAKFLRGLSEQEKISYASFVFRRFADFERREDSRCGEKYGMSAAEHYDTEHPV